MITIEAPTKDMIDGIYEIELDSFSIPWSKGDLEKDMFENKLSIYLLALDDGKPVGYIGMWHVVNEGHITNLAVKSEYRRRGIGNMLVTKLIEISREKEMLGITLECRMGNTEAQRLYNKHGFKPEGLRKRYYADTGEDAIIMWKYF